MLCEYGCGKEATHQFKNSKLCCSKSVNSCPVKKKPDLNSKNPGICEYGCGEPAVYQFTNGKWCCSNSHTKCLTFRKKKSESTKGKCYLPKDFIEKQRSIMLNGRAKFMNSFPRDSEKERIRRINQKQRMLDGQAVYMNRFIRNPSKPQVELYKRVKELYPNAILNYPCYQLNFSLDVAIPDLMICFESDGTWYHQDHEKDIKRQTEIEKLGWVVVRYYPVDTIKQVPSKDQIKQDIIDVINNKVI